MAAEKGKRLKVADKVEDDNPLAVDEKLILSIEKLQEIQDELDKINEEANDKVLEVEQKYNEIRKPFYDKRKDVINSIPDFWLTAVLSHPAFNGLLTEEDQKIFRYLSSLEVEDFKDMKSGFSISFNFKPNPYFEDTQISKSFSFLEEGTTKISATSIKWTEGLANGAYGKKKGNKRPPADESFFRWFTDTQHEDDEIQDEIVEIIKEDLWPNPLAYFNNEVDEVDFDEDADEDADEEGKQDASEEGDEDDEEDN